MYDDEEFESFVDEARTCPVTGKKEKKTLKSVLNKKGRITKHEMDEIFLNDF